MQHEPWGVEETIFNRYIKRLIKISAKMKSGFEACAIPQNNFGDGTAGPAKGEKRGLKSTQRGTVPELRDAHVDIARRGRASIRPTALRRDFEFILGDPLLIVERLSPRSEYKLAGCYDANGNVTPDAPIAGPGSPSCRVAIGYPSDANPLRFYPGGINRLTFNNFSPKLGVQVHPSDDIMIYGSWSKGYKTGGWTTRFTTPQTAAASYEPEKATTFELGVKSTLLDRHLQLNAAVFTTKYSGIQLNYQVGTSPTIDNVGDARIKGFEIEANAVPFDGFSINASVGYLDAYYTRLDPAVAVTSGAIAGFQAGALVGGELPKTPEWKINVSPRLELPLAGGAKITLLGDWTYTAHMWNNVERTLVLYRPSTNLFNASIAFEDASSRYTVTLGGTNLSNERYLSSGSAIAASGAISGVYSRPREWYLRFGFNF